MGKGEINKVGNTEKEGKGYEEQKTINKKYRDDKRCKKKRKI